MTQPRGAARVDQVPMPPSIAELPRNKAGYPIPWFVDRDADVDGEPDFRIMDARKIMAAVQLQLCWVCGEPMAMLELPAFVIGPMCAVNRTSAEPPSHYMCAKYSAQVCPFLTVPNMVRREGHKPENSIKPPGIMLERNPGVTLVWTSKRGTAMAFQHGTGLLFDIGEPRRAEWFCEGRPATAEEVIRSINSGMPILEKVAREEGDEAVAELDRRYHAVLSDYLPHPKETADAS